MTESTLENENESREDRDKLLQARIPEDVHRWLAGVAREDGFKSVAGWLRHYLVELKKARSKEDTK